MEAFSKNSSLSPPAVGTQTLHVCGHFKHRAAILLRRWEGKKSTTVTAVLHCMYIKTLYSLSVMGTYRQLSILVFCKVYNVHIQHTEGSESLWRACAWEQIYCSAGWQPSHLYKAYTSLYTCRHSAGWLSWCLNKFFLAHLHTINFY